MTLYIEQIGIIENELALPGSIVLLNRGVIVYIGRLGDPIEDAEFTSIILHPRDMQRLWEMVND